MEALVRGIRKLAQSSPQLTLGQAQPQFTELARAAGALDFCFNDSSGRRLAGQTQLQNVLARAASVTVTVAWNPGLTSPVDRQGTQQLAQAVGESAEATPAVGAAGGDSSAARERFIIEFDRLERANSFMAAKFVIDKLIPQVGIPLAEAKHFLRRLEADGIVETTKVPSRNNPEFQATRVQLNRTHPTVKGILANGKLADFQPLRIPGGPLSEDIIRDRR